MNVDQNQKIIIRCIENSDDRRTTFDLDCNFRMTMDSHLACALLDQKREDFHPLTIKNAIVSPLAQEAIGFLIEKLRNDSFIILRNGNPEIISG